MIGFSNVHFRGGVGGRNLGVLGVVFRPSDDVGNTERAHYFSPFVIPGDDVLLDFVVVDDPLALTTSRITWLLEVVLLQGPDDVSLVPLLVPDVGKVLAEPE